MRYILLLINLYFVHTAGAAIRDIPRQDLKNIKYLFERLINGHDFSYTILGSKPMSLAEYGLKVPAGLPIHRWIRSRYLLMRGKAGLQAWYNYKNEFDLKDFIFLDEERDLFRCLVLVIINKTNMLQVLRQHEAVFKQELGDAFTPESFLKKLEKRELSLAQSTHKSQRLLGIMLGYGESNATLFQERYDLMRAISKRKKDNLPLDSALTEKLHAIEAQLGDFSAFEENPIVPPLYFLADISHLETIELKKRYENDRQKIEELMKKPHFMDRVIQRLTQ